MTLMFCFIIDREVQDTHSKLAHLSLLAAVFQLGVMASRVLNCTFPYFAIPYGCWCGINVVSADAIPEPVDDFDAACRDHDACYERVATKWAPHCDSTWTVYDWGTEMNNTKVMFCKNMSNGCKLLQGFYSALAQKLKA